MSERSRYASDNCSVARTLAVIGEKWTLLVLREAFYGQRRFEEIQHTLGIARNILAARLQTLVDHGLLARTPYKATGSRERFEYRLTERGVDLYPILVALMGWGDKHLSDEDGPPTAIRHRGCGAHIHIDVRCDDGHSHLGARDCTVEPGPGARIAQPA